MIRLVSLSFAAMLAASPVMAGDGPEPPHAPTPDEAATAQAAPPPTPAATARDDGGGKAAARTGQDKAAGSKPDQAKAGQDEASAGDAVRKAQENGSYKMKDGGMYQPPQSRPAPMWNKGYGRT